jgi:hypothetical protein
VNRAAWHPRAAGGAGAGAGAGEWAGILATAADDGDVLVSDFTHTSTLHTPPLYTHLSLFPLPCRSPKPFALPIPVPLPDPPPNPPTYQRDVYM